MAEPKQSALELPPWAIDGLWMAALGVVAVSLYAATTCPTIYWYDSAEFVVAGATLGIPHAPGYPVYVWFAHLFTRLPLDAAYAVNLMSAVFGAADVVLVFAVARRLGASRLAAAIGALLLFGGPVFWHNAVVAEVYTPGLFGLLLTWWFALGAWHEGKAWMALAAAAVAGASLGLHYFVATTGLGLAWLVLWRGLDPAGPLSSFIERQNLARRLGVAAACLPAVALGACVFLWLPHRAAQAPPINFGRVNDLDRFVAYLRGTGFMNLFGEVDTWGRLKTIGGLLLRNTGWVGLPLAAAGLAGLARRRPSAALALSLGVLGNLWFFWRYLVRDVEVFFLPAIALLCIAAAFGVDGLAGLGPRTGDHESLKDEPDPPAWRRWASPAVAGFVGLVMIVITLPEVDRGADRSAAEYGERIVEELPPDSVVLFYQTPEESFGASVFLVYHQLYLRSRPDVHIVDRPPPQAVAQMLTAGYPVWAFADPPALTQHFHIERGGPLLRVRFPLDPEPSE